MRASLLRIVLYRRLSGILTSMPTKPQVLRGISYLQGRHAGSKCVKIKCSAPKAQQSISMSECVLIHFHKFAFSLVMGIGGNINILGTYV